MGLVIIPQHSQLLFLILKPQKQNCKTCRCGYLPGCCVPCGRDPCIWLEDCTTVKPKEEDTYCLGEKFHLNNSPLCCTAMHDAVGYSTQSMSYLNWDKDFQEMPKRLARNNLRYYGL
jgi:hypothetical protein